ncbi:Malonyl CoA-acyl carrier protein transacylase, mitochondrial [Schizosaccharomyces pombe]|uniref:Malonyl CoA-acyl carrier protein transacylase, mitochondrial n=1 Tax=Schizosaccharomyces pombe (strain 972 / ATCC 24843) TaxID=284812 RepID=FABD_SCHPO|nr:putative S-malonyltransferase Mct1 [Schizosaccharomyces pombe]O13698.1 RecName: Full=Malonyl CoA-acyl carrier protein transacylase, mitochondrial; Short=MCT; AltName: Full=Malonyl-CoA:ACP transferase; Flags: Precursor [Schizosaccharomyces pombe 972h-]CAB16210.1 mitochondrial [acyl-carrier protein] S-malonyltransferase Mct1 (predicted) [Schizosaccharomyces pombe]|eukprot:NP_594399.1 putative S-malonyltransferase Mct1 [Schizosaccharomyces pombe]
MSAILFPGQGVDWKTWMQPYLENNIVQNTLKEAENVTEIEIRKYIVEAEAKSNLRQPITTIAQPAILACSIALLRAFPPFTKKFRFYVGHSLGEYSAFVASQTLSFSSALKLVQARAKAMSYASALCQNPTSMLAITLTSRFPTDNFLNTVYSAVQKYRLIDIANVNSDRQIVLSGDKKELESITSTLSELVRSLGKLRSNWLDVSGAFHSRYMLPARDSLKNALGETEFNISPELCYTDSGKRFLPIISNVTAELYPADEEDIRRQLLLQCFRPVLFKNCLKTVKSKYGANLFYAYGPGTTMQSIAKQNGISTKSRP